MASVADMLNQIAFNFHAAVFFEFVSGYAGVVLLLVVGYLLHFVPQSVTDLVEKRVINMSLPMKAACIVAVIVIVIQTKSAGVQPFIYFQF